MNKSQSINVTETLRNALFLWEIIDLHAFAHQAKTKQNYLSKDCIVSSLKLIFQPLSHIRLIVTVASLSCDP